MARAPVWEPNFHNLELVLQRRVPPRPVLFEFILASAKEKLLIGKEIRQETEFDRVVTTIKAFGAAGYDHATIIVRGLSFPRREDTSHHQMATKSLNFGAMITDWETFNAYQWPSIAECDFSIIDQAAKYLVGKAKLVPFSFDGILENVIGIMGYEQLCYLLYDEPDLVAKVFHEVGSRLEAYFQKCLEYSAVGAIICNDDWGFNSQTMVPPAVLREHVFPWYKRIVARAHACGKYAILHSCGYYHDIIEDIIADIRFDGRHSYEDKIVPIERAYGELAGRIAVIGGLDVDFLTRASSTQVYERSRNMLLLTKESGGYALGSGNSIPDYIPDENYLAMLNAAYDLGDL